MDKIQTAEEEKRTEPTKVAPRSWWASFKEILGCKKEKKECENKEENKRSENKKENKDSENKEEEKDLPSLLVDLKGLVPKCSSNGTANKPAGQSPTSLANVTSATSGAGGESQQRPENANTTSAASAPTVSRSFLSRLLIRIDKDHNEFLVDLDSKRNPRAPELTKRIADWESKPEHTSWGLLTGSTSWALTVSKTEPASLSPSIKKPDPSANPEKKALFLQATGHGQKALVELAKELLSHSGKEATCHGGDSLEGCKKDFLDQLEMLIKLLEGQKDPTRIEPFEPLQTFELTFSSILNSPDITNRLEYLTTYVYFYPYPYPANGNIILEKEFWKRFEGIQLQKSASERRQSLAADLDRVWRDLQVKIANVETLVQYASLQVAQISREAGQGVNVKAEPTIELAGAAKGKPGSVALESQLKTTVTEKLLKELDRRSTWLNATRNMLRITQRGLEAINIAGSFKEKVILHIPASYDDIHFLDLVDNEVSLKPVGQPLYGSVPAIAISLAVVREPYEFKRSAAEKFGLPDSADAYYILVVSHPVKLNLWQWDRKVYFVDTDDIDVRDRPPKKLNSKVWLKFFSPSSGVEDHLLLSPKGSADFIAELRKGLYGLIHPLPPDRSSVLHVECRRSDPTGGIQDQQPDGKPKPVYFVIKSKKDPLETFWIGKQDQETGAMVPFDGSENDFIYKLMGKQSPCH